MSRVVDRPTAPDPGEEAQAALRRWRSKAAEAMLLFFALSIIPHLAAWLVSYDLPATVQWSAVVLLIGILVTAGVFAQRWPPAVRVWLLLLVSYLASIQGLVWYSGAMARLWLLGAPILALILAGRRSAWIAAAISIGLMALHTLGAITGTTSGLQVPGFEEGRPGVIVARAVMWITYFLPLLVLLFQFDRFQVRTLAMERATSARLADELTWHQRATESLERGAAERDRLEREIERVAEEERRRLGHDLHDGVSQQLALALMSCSALEARLATEHPAAAGEVSAIAEALDSTLQEVQEVASNLARMDMNPEALPSALDALARKATSSFGVRCEYRGNADPTALDRGNTLDLYRIAQEAVNNAGKHARAGSITVTLSGQDRHLLLTVEDDGKGLQVPAAGSGMGLGIMALRAQRIGGRLALESSPEGGTRVVCEVPVGGARGG